MSRFSHLDLVICSSVFASELIFCVSKCLFLGATENDMEQNEFLRAVVVPIVDQADCNAAYNNIITSNMICAGIDAGGKDSCQVILIFYLNFKT